MTRFRKVKRWGGGGGYTHSDRNNNVYDNMKDALNHGKKTYEEAIRLYNNCLNDGCEMIHPPYIWVKNIDFNRNMYEKYVEEMSSMPEPMKSMMMENSAIIYQKFMYENYRPESVSKFF